MVVDVWKVIERVLLIEPQGIEISAYCSTLYLINLLIEPQGIEMAEITQNPFLLMNF